MSEKQSEAFKHAQAIFASRFAGDGGTDEERWLFEAGWQAALSHAEGEATPDYVLDALDNLMHDNYERSYRGAKNRQDDAELIRCALRRSHPAPAGDTLSHAEGAVDREGLADALYLAGYSAARKERDYDPRGCDQWQAVVDAIRAHPAPQVAVPDEREIAARALEGAADVLDAFGQVRCASQVRSIASDHRDAPQRAGKEGEQ